MKAFVVVRHYDIGSDEVAVEGVFASERRAALFVVKMFPGWTYDGDYDGFFEDATDRDTCDRLYILQSEFFDQKF